MILTLEEAKELSEKKWQVIVDNGGKDYNIEELIPELEGLRNECAMCEYVLNQRGEDCEDCIYNKTACDLAYREWVNKRCIDTALDVLNQIKLSNRL